MTCYSSSRKPVNFSSCSEQYTSSTHILSLTCSITSKPQASYFSPHYGLSMPCREIYAHQNMYPGANLRLTTLSLSPLCPESNAHSSLADANSAWKLLVCFSPFRRCHPHSSSHSHPVAHTSVLQKSCHDQARCTPFATTSNYCTVSVIPACLQRRRTQWRPSQNTHGTSPYGIHYNQVLSQPLRRLQNRMSRGRRACRDTVDPRVR